MLIPFPSIIQLQVPNPVAVINQLIPNRHPQSLHPFQLKEAHLEGHSFPKYFQVIYSITFALANFCNAFELVLNADFF